MDEHPNAKLLRDMGERMKAGDFEAAFDVMADGVEWHEIGRSEPTRGKEALGQRYAFAEHVQLVDGGTQGLYLLHHVQGAKQLLIFDAIDYGLPPGTLKVVEDDEVPRFLGAKKMSLHQTGFQEVLSLAQLTGHYPERVLLIGCQPEELEDYGVITVEYGRDAESGDGSTRQQNGMYSRNHYRWWELDLAWHNYTNPSRPRTMEQQLELALRDAADNKTLRDLAEGRLRELRAQPSADATS